MEIDIGELRDGLREHLALVRSGHTLTVTDHGQHIARIVPVAVFTRLEQLRPEGLVTRAQRRKGPAPDPVVVAGSVSDLVAEQRG